MNVDIERLQGRKSELSDFADLMASFFQHFILSYPLRVKYIIKRGFFRTRKNCHRLSLKRIMARKRHVILAQTIATFFCTRPCKIDSHRIYFSIATKSKEETKKVCLWKKIPCLHEYMKNAYKKQYC